MMRVQDEERRRIARELHDGLGQWLAAAQINLDIALLQWRRAISHTAGNAKTHRSRGIQHSYHVLSSASAVAG